MKLLIVAATFPEIKPLVLSLGEDKANEPGIKTIHYRQASIDILITGVGLMHTAYLMGKILANNTYNLALQFGIAGSFRKDLAPGMTVNVVEEVVADFGAEDKENFLDATELHLLPPDQFPYHAGKLMNTTPDSAHGASGLKKAKGISVNKVHGYQDSIDRIIKKYQPDIESMEGAAFFYACLMERIPCLQIRTISNYIEDRNKGRWNVPLAIDNLNTIALKIIHHNYLALMQS
ncbi:MAG: futalosine hydrolase [Candidatus Brocadia sp.]|nr:futalosine hydrolase [Candidatus Brocadia sp.]MCE7912745.1 futalosine hydrolase [Candidatus Brocadia sp. AMX3]MDG5996761.1 futalosine hydrolase [Candidatus Brocadia sp.]RIJ93703.1 MAG: futalosine hydrolase [Candidatus Brocadia sp.]